MTVTTDRASRIVSLFHKLVGTARSRGPSDDHTEELAEDLFEGIKELLESGEERVELRSTWNQLFLNDDSVPLRGRGTAVHRAVHRLLWDNEVGRLQFQKNVLQPELARFADLLLNATGQMEGTPPVKAIQQEMGEGGIFGISVEKREEAPDIPSNRPTYYDVRQTSILYFDLLYALKSLLSDLKEGLAPKLLKLRRLAQQLVDQVLAGNQLTVAMTSVQRHESYMHAHAVNTGIYAAWLAVALGLDRGRIVTIVLAAMVADLGLFFNAKFILDKIEESGEFNQLEWNIVRRHPLEGAKLLLKGEGLSDFTVRALLVTFQHHYTPELPLLKRLEETDLFSRIIAIADCFDNRRTTRNKKAALPPPEAHASLFEDTAEFFDPDLVELFVTAVGVYPTGTLVKLSDGRIGVVRTQNVEKQFLDRPTIRIFGDEKYQPIDRVADLSTEPDLTIERTYTLPELDLDVPSYLSLL